MRLKFFIILILSWSNSFSQRNAIVVFEETQADSINYKIDSILLIGTGTTATRIFLDELSQYIIKDLTDKVKNSFSDFIDGVKETYAGAEEKAEEFADKAKAGITKGKEEFKNALS